MGLPRGSKLIMATDNDFGFSLVDEDELAKVQELQKEATQHAATAIGTQTKMQGLVQMIMPLLDNLSAHPEKDYIHWPNRVKKIQEFKKKLNDYIST